LRAAAPVAIGTGVKTDTGFAINPAAPPPDHHCRTLAETGRITMKAGLSIASLSRDM
jgi:hypothetical protein